MALLDREAYKVERDELIYDGTHPIDAGAVQVTVNTTTPATANVGTIARGQVIDGAGGTYKVHASGGVPKYVAAEAVEYAADDLAVTVPVYLSGAFRKSKVVSDPALTAADIDALRQSGIFLK